MSYLIGYGLDKDLILPENFFIDSSQSFSIKPFYINYYKIKIILLDDEMNNIKLLDDNNYLAYSKTKDFGFIYLNSQQTLKINKCSIGYILENFPHTVLSDYGILERNLSEIITNCKLTISILDRGDEEEGYVFDNTIKRDLEHSIYINGILNIKKEAINNNLKH